MTAIFGSDKDKEQAVALRRLLMRLQNGEGEDRPLGADIMATIGAPAEMGDPTGCLDCAMYLADFLKMNRVDTLAHAVIALKARVNEGWKKAGEVTGPDAARAIACIIVKSLIARLEGTPV